MRDHHAHACAAVPASATTSNRSPSIIMNYIFINMSCPTNSLRSSLNSRDGQADWLNPPHVHSLEHPPHPSNPPGCFMGLSRLTWVPEEVLAACPSATAHSLGRRTLYLSPRHLSALNRRLLHARPIGLDNVRCFTFYRWSAHLGYGVCMKQFLLQCPLPLSQKAYLSATKSTLFLVYPIQPFPTLRLGGFPQ